MCECVSECVCRSTRVHHMPLAGTPSQHEGRGISDGTFHLPVGSATQSFRVKKTGQRGRPVIGCCCFFPFLVENDVESVASGKLVPRSELWLLAFFP